MKKIILLVMSFAVSMCLLVGCADNKSDTYPEVTSEPVATSTTYSKQEQYYLNNYYRAKHILIMTENRTSLEAEELCDNLYEQAQNGKDFDLLIREYSEDPGCAKNPNGYFFTDGQMVIEFENAVKSIDVGEFTTCKSYYGYHVVQRLALDETPEIFKEGYENTVLDNSDKIEGTDNPLLGKWISTSNNLTWIYEENVFIIDYSTGFPNDNSAEAIKVRNLEPSYIPYKLEDNRIIYSMGGASYKNKFTISNDVLTITNSISGDISTFVRGK